MSKNFYRFTTVLLLTLVVILFINLRSLGGKFRALQSESYYTLEKLQITEKSKATLVKNYVELEIEYHNLSQSIQTQQDLLLTFQTICNIYDIEWKLVYAIAKHETGNFKSNAWLTKNNPGGIMYWNGKKSVLRQFDNIEQGIHHMAKMIKNGYIDKGSKSIEDIGKYYAPIGANNDPNNLNQHWVKKVKQYYKDLGGAKY